VLGAKTPDFMQLDVSVLCPRHDGASDPPVGTGQPRGQIGARSRLPMLLSPARAGKNLAMRWLPEPDKVTLLAEHDCVVPPPDHRLGAIRLDRDGY
jgi:hypothetical protein